LSRPVDRTLNFRFLSVKHSPSRALLLPEEEQRDDLLLRLHGDEKQMICQVFRDLGRVYKCLFIDDCVLEQDGVDLGRDAVTFVKFDAADCFALDNFGDSESMRCQVLWNRLIELILYKCIGLVKMEVDVRLRRISQVEPPAFIQFIEKYC